jgi:hypothetical protein
VILRYIILFLLNILDTSLRSIGNKISDLSKNMVKMSHAVRQIASDSANAVSRFLLLISFEMDYSRVHIILIIIVIQIVKKHFQIK